MKIQLIKQMLVLHIALFDCFKCILNSNNVLLKNSDGSIYSCINLICLLLKTANLCAESKASNCWRLCFNTSCLLLLMPFPLASASVFCLRNKNNQETAIWSKRYVS